MTEEQINRAAETIARVSYEMTCNGPKPDDDDWRDIWEMAYPESIRERHREMARAAAPILRGEA